MHKKVTYEQLKNYVGTSQISTIPDEMLNLELICGNLYDDEGYSKDIFKLYIISEMGYEFLKNHSNEIVFYDPQLNLYFWGITFCGTSWRYVYTTLHDVEF